MAEIFVQPLVGTVCLIVFHDIQAVMDFRDDCAWQLSLQVVSSHNSSQQNFFYPFGPSFGTHICMPHLPLVMSVLSHTIIRGCWKILQ
jgi:hypothetical protein